MACGVGDCFFRAESHQLYGEANYHMNIHSVGVQYMRAYIHTFYFSFKLKLQFLTCLQIATLV